MPESVATRRNSEPLPQKKLTKKNKNLCQDCQLNPVGFKEFQCDRCLRHEQIFGMAWPNRKAATICSTVPTVPQSLVVEGLSVPNGNIYQYL
jgi:hypothetical protein